MMPRLSTDLKGPKGPDDCQSCDTDLFQLQSIGGLIRWQEHDDKDHPEPIVVVLCEGCSKRLIDAHPRLYRQLQPFEPFPGAMGICLDCAHRDGTSCKHPSLIANGGKGLALDVPTPSFALVDGTRNGRRTGWRQTFYTGPVTACAGKETVSV